MHQKLTLNRLQDLLDKTAALNVAVVGDFSIEQTLTCSSPADDSKPNPVRVTNVRYGLGGAGRIVQLLAAAGVQAIRPVGIVGNDGYGWQLMKMLQPLRCDLDDLCVADNWFTAASITQNRDRKQKTRRMMPSLDAWSSTPIPKPRITELLQKFASLASHVDLVIVYDAYPEEEAGLFSPYFRNVISEVASKLRRVPFVVESKHFIGQYSHVVARITANQLLESGFADHPVSQSQGDDEKSQIHVYEELQSAALKLRRQTLKPVLVSLGEKGILTCDGSTSVIPALPVNPPVDRSSANDCMTALTAAAIACDASPIEAAQMAMLGANVVMHQQTLPRLATRSQLLDRFRTINQIGANT